MPTIITVTQLNGTSLLLATADLVYATNNGTYSTLTQENNQTNPRQIQVEEDLSEIVDLDGSFLQVTLVSGESILLGGYRIKSVEDLGSFRRISYEGVGLVNRTFDVTDTEAAIKAAVNSISGGSTFTDLVIQGDAAVGYGLLELKSTTSSVSFSGGATETIPVQIPVGASILAVQLRNDTILVGSGASNYTATTTSTSTGTIPSTGSINFNKNTKTNALFSGVVAGVVEDLVLTPDAGTLDTGTVTAVVYYYELTSITDAP